MDKIARRKKNLVLMVPSLKHGGAERVVSRLSFLLNNDYNLKIVIFDDNEITYDAFCDVHSLEVPSKPKIFHKFINVIKRIKRYRIFKKNFDVDITYSFGDTANIVNVLSGGVDKKITSIRGYKGIRREQSLLNKFILKPTSKLICKLADNIISVSNLISLELAQEYGINPKKIFTVHNGYDVERIKLLSLEELDGSERYIFQNGSVLITAGTFRQEKGYWHLLKAFSLVLKECKNVKLVILGFDNSNYKNKVLSLIKELNIEDFVFVLGYKNNPYKYFKQSTMYVLSSVFEGFPNTLVEAMACGLPIVASDCPSGPKEIVAPNSNLEVVTKGVQYCEYGILTSRPSPEENFNANEIDESDYDLAKGILSMLNDDNIEKYSKLSVERSLDFNFEIWREKHTDIIG